MYGTSNPPKIATDLLPLYNEVQNIGSPSNKWGTIYADLLASYAEGIENVAGTTSVDISNGNLEARVPTGKHFQLFINSIGALYADSTQFDVGTKFITAGDFFSDLGKTLNLSIGSNAKAGTFTANGTSAVTVSNTSITAGSVIIITLKTVGGTVGAVPHVDTITPSTGFTIKGTAADSSTYNYAIIEIA